MEPITVTIEPFWYGLCGGLLIPVAVAVAMALVSASRKRKQK